VTPTVEREPARSPVSSIFAVLRRRYRWGLGVGAVVFGFAAALILLARPVYRAEARLRLGEPPPNAGVSSTSGMLNLLRMGGDPFANDLELLSSRTLTEEVVRAQVLSVGLGAPRGWHRDSVLVSLALSASDTTARARYEASWSDDGFVTVEQVAPRDSLIGTFRVGETAAFGGAEIAFAERKPDGPRTVELRVSPFGDAVRRERSRLRVERTRREANVLEIHYTHHDPAVAVGAVAAAVEGFIRLRTTLFQRESSESVDSIRTVALRTHEELRAAEDAVEELQRSAGLLDPEPQSEALIQRYETLYAQLLETRTEAELLDARLARVAESADRIESWSMLLGHPPFLENETMGARVQQLITLEQGRMQALTLRQPESLDVRALEEQIVLLDNGLRTLVAQYRDALDEGIRDLESQVEELEVMVQALPTQVVELGRRQRDVNILSQMVVLTEQRLRQEELREALAYSNVQVVDPPALRYRPVWPRPGLGLIVSMLAAMMSGLVAMVLVERADMTVRSFPRLRAMTGAPVLAAPIAHNGTRELRSVELEALKRATPGGCSVVYCRGAEDSARLVADALGPIVRRGPAPVEIFADAVAVADDPILIVMTAGRTAEPEVRRVTDLLREAGARVVGTVVSVGSAKEVRALWD
jgi:uncharacterized protein involved in exopolysaccharide biosynthesis